MEYRELGKTGIRVSAIGFGGWAIGGAIEASGAPLGWGRTSDDDSLAAIRRARDLGVTFYDTADSYGFGRSESLLGIVLSRHRQEVVIATKVGVVRTASGALKKDFSRQHIFHAVDGSLKRLRSDYVDLYQVHNPTIEELRREEIQEAMDRLQDAGKIRFWGVSISTPEEGIEIVQRGWAHALQVLYNVLNQAPATDLFPLAKERG
ncbi:MAG TPA: aldo/keto reductase, partial [Thermoanaerobaculia bacterium]|nr:aldo/keto reductase [Thermoanaerobaculia bacterium]